jgi:ATP-binding cassette subfamily B (MDR/TAP) protein 1
VDRALVSIATVNVFNAALYKQQSLNEVFERLNRASNKLDAMWGATSVAAQFVTMAGGVRSELLVRRKTRQGR